MSRFTQLALSLGAPVPVPAPPTPVVYKAPRSGDPHPYPCVVCGKVEIGPLDGHAKSCGRCRALKPMTTPLPAHWRLAAYKGFREWLLKLWQRGYVHGSELVDAMWRAYERSSPGPAAADSLLNEAEKLGWILRRENDPTLSQRVDARLSRKKLVADYYSWTNTAGQTSAQFYASHWYFSPNRESTEASVFLASDAGARS